MSFSVNDLKNLTNSKEYKNYKDKNYRFLLLWEKIYTRRKDLWLTQSELSKSSKIPQNKISDLEHWVYWEPKSELLSRLSTALQIPLEYLLDNISRKTVELYNYIFSQIGKNPDIMQYMKIPYFIDLQAIETTGNKFTNFDYIRWNYWPFDKKVYDYQKLFSYNLDNRIEDLKYIYLSEEDREIIDSVLGSIPVSDWDKLKMLSYESEPMKMLGVELGDDRCMGEELKF